MGDAVRLNRFLSESGLGSRRGVERLIREGRVRIDGEVVEDLGRRVDPEADRVEVDGRLVRPQALDTLLALHKPVGAVSSFARQDTRPCLLDFVPGRYLRGRLFHVGRLDADSSGLLLLAADGDLAQRLLHPRHPVWKTYEVEADGELEPAIVESWRAGRTTLGGRALLPVRIEALAPRRWRLQLREGRNRQIRRMFEGAGRHVLRLHRVAFGPIDLGGLPPGALRELGPRERAELESLARD